MAEFQLVMPKMGESIAEATIIKWTKNEGDAVALDETVLEIATDKVDSEVPSPYAGTLIKKLFNENDVVPVGAAIAIIADSSSAGVTSAPPAAKMPVAEAPKEVAVVEKQIQHLSSSHKPTNSGGNRFYSPLVLNIARAENVSMPELENIAGTGAEGRVTKRDILAFVSARTQAPTPQTTTAPAEPKPVTPAPTPTATPASAPSIQAPKVTLMSGDEIIEMDRMRKIIADNMVMSKHVSPHVTSFVECDVTNLVRWRDKIKNAFEKKEGEKITFTPIFMECVVRAIKDFPMINISVDGTNIVKRKNINIGMATALPSGNLIVPVVKNADYMNLTGLTKKVNDLANRARQSKLQADEISGGTFTITNVGTFGNVMGTPIIPQPQVAIMAIGAIRKKPAVLETPEGDVIAIRQMMFLSLSYDHRVVDGMLGGSFIRRVADYMENWDSNREI